MKSLFLSITIATAVLAGAMIAGPPATVTAAAQDCKSSRGELLPGADACLVWLGLALRPDGYVLRFESGADQDYRDMVAIIAAELSDITDLSFRVGSDVAPAATPQVGEIVVRLHIPTSTCHGGSACAAGQQFGRWPWVAGGDEIQGGQIYLTTNIDSDSSATQAAAIRHELGHVLGLRHYDYLPDEQPSHQVMAWNVRSTGVSEWQAGDLAALRYLADYERRSPTARDVEAVATDTGLVVNGSITDPSSPASQAVLVRIDGSTAIATTIGAVVVTTPGPHEVCVTLANAGAGTDVDLGCSRVTVPDGPRWWLMLPLLNGRH